MARQIEISLTKRNVRGRCHVSGGGCAAHLQRGLGRPAFGRGRLSRPLGRPRGLYAGAAVRHRSGQGERHDSADRRGLALFRDPGGVDRYTAGAAHRAAFHRHCPLLPGATTFCSAPPGYSPGNLFATISENLEGLAEACESIWREGFVGERMVIRRIEWKSRRDERHNSDPGGSECNLANAKPDRQSS